MSALNLVVNGSQRRVDAPPEESLLSVLRNRLQRRQADRSRSPGPARAVFEAVRFENGRIVNPRFSQYRVPRFPDAPQIETVILDRKDLPPAGAGETPIVGLAPAVGNAIFAAAGIRLRKLPLAPDGLPGK